ncbi:hypothetical protein [Limosilactobacillus reuteri]|uniref:hypothetical protein n=1 Tax=Limosilactobacillus reuteri TaxID=1598 RepID=UPI001E497E97|nr:hypothetical protein [Limosilactobacillus reuteri]MCC4466844.1 hypothetical protein [Limosilactobacillus reuteri]MCC4472910.1 hypothetical protein [Limosilactobacillus reuteri]
MAVNFDSLILGSNIQLTDNVTIYVPTIADLANKTDASFGLYQRIFSVSVRELFSGMPAEVDKIEEEFPTLWEIAFDKDMSKEVGSNMFQEGATVLEIIMGGICYWTRTDPTDYQILVQSKKIVSEEYDWVIDKDAFIDFCDHIKMITLYKRNEDLIAPKGISSHPNQCRVWEGLYKGRVNKLRHQPDSTLGDKILILQTEASSLIPFDEIGKMTYYQFMNLYYSFEIKEANEREYQIFVSEKFDTKDMKLKDWRDSVSLIKKEN